MNGRPHRRRAPPPGHPRKGGVLLLVAGGIVALLGIAGLALDTNLWFHRQSRLEHMTRAASAAGYERLKELDFRYGNLETRRRVDQTIREYLELNGATREEAASAQISVSKRNEVSVRIHQVTGSFLARVAGIDQVRLSGAGVLSATNDVAPFAVPIRYHDPDHDLVANFEARSGRIEETRPFELYKPYVIKFGKPVFAASDDFVLIPMDSVEHVIPPEAFASIKVPTSVPGRFERAEQPARIPPQHIDATSAFSVGIFRAYGIAYAILGLGEVDGESATLNWMLGLAGGSFLVKRKFLEAAGYAFEEVDAGVGVILDEKGNATNTVAQLLRLSDRDHVHHTRDFALFRYLTDVLPTMEPPPIQVLVLSEQPQVLTVTGSADPVTRVMDFARIPYVAVSDQWNPKLHKDPNTSCVASYRIQDEFPKAFDSPKAFRAFLETTPNASAYLKRRGRLRVGDRLEGPLRERGFDWVHIHHEDFTEAGTYPREKRSMVLGLRDFVRRGHHHLFAACLAIESLEIFLSASDFGEKPTGLYPEMLDYGSTLAFRSFELDETRGGHRRIGPYSSSSIDGELSEARTGPGQGVEARWFLTDYLNPRCQNHDGLGGVRLDLSKVPPALTPTDPDPDRRMLAPEGATNTMLLDFVKPYSLPRHDGTEVKGLNRPVLVLGAVGAPPGAGESWTGKNARYLTGVADDDNDLANGHGQFTFLGGHRPSVAGGFTRVGNLMEGTYYDDNDVWVPEVLHLPGGATLKLDLDGDGKAASMVEIVRLGKGGAKPRSLSPKPDERQGWPTVTAPPAGPPSGAPGGATGVGPSPLATGATALPSLATTSTTSAIVTTGAATGPDKLPSIDWNDPAARWVAATGRDNFVALHESSAVVIHDLNNDGDSDDVFPGDLYEVGQPSVPGYRIYLNNILYGAVAISGERKSKLNLGTINPATLKLGDDRGSFGYLDSAGTGGSLRDILQYGYTIPGGLPLGKEFSTAPGIFTEQISKAMAFNFRDSQDRVDSVRWSQSDQGKRAGPTQVKIVPVVERVDDPGKSFYHGYDPHRVRIIGFARFFLIDTSIDEATLTEDAKDPNYLGGPPLEGEIRGHFLGWVLEPPGAR